MSAEQIKSDTLTILLCNKIHKLLPIKDRAIKIAKCCKLIRDKTSDDVLQKACRNVIKATKNGHYRQVVDSINTTEYNYYREYK